MVSVRKAVVLSMAQRYAAFFIQFATSIVLARLLSPAETGIFSLAAAVAGIAQMLRDFGVGEYIIQERDLTRDKLRSALGVTLIMSWSIAGVLLLLAQPVAAFYNEAGVANVVYVLALNFVLIPFASTTFAVLTKELAYGLIFKIQTLSTALSAAVCIGLAVQGFSYMSMAWSSLVNILATALLVAAIRPRDTFMLPGFSGLRAVAKFGGGLTIGRLADQACRRAPDFFIGSHLGFSAVGIQSKATTLLDAFNDFFTSGIARVAVPAFAKGERDPAKTHADYLRGSRILLLFPFVFYGFCGLFADPIIQLLFGDQWLAAAPLVQIASIANLVFAPYLLGTPALTGYGRVGNLVRMQVVTALFYLPAIFIASKISLFAVAIAIGLVSIPRFYLMQRGLYDTFKLSAHEIYACAAKSALIALVAVGCSAPALLIYQHTTLSAFYTLLTAGSILVVSAVGAAYLSKHPLSDEVLNLIRSRRTLQKASHS